MAMDETLLPPLPRSVQIEPVGQCNLRCRMCPVQFRPGGQHGAPAFMQFDTFRSLLDQFDGMSELHLQGLGEPMLHPRFFDMVELAASRDIRVSTNTNMTVMTEEQAERCVTSGLHALHVSIDAADPQVYETVRVGAKLPLVLRNLRRVTAARAQLGEQTPRVSLVAVLMRSTLDGLPDLVSLAAGAGVSAMSVQQLCHDFSEDSLPPHYLPMRAFVEREMLREPDRAHAQDVFAMALARAQQQGVALRLPRLVPRPHGDHVPGRMRCDWPWREAYVAYDGQAMPCCMVATPDRQQLGNMVSDGVAAVWNGDAYQRFRERLASSDPPPVCAGCAIYRGTF
jgi:radical SAM protein with 4Fe4S-binding SPASM domain